MGKSHILSAFSFKGKKSSELKVDEVSDQLKNDNLCWVHLDVNNPKSEDWLKEEVSYLDEIIIDALLAEDTRPRLVEYKTGSMIILRGVNLNKNAEPEDMVSVRIWVDSKRIITAQKRNIKAIGDMAKKIKAGAYFATSGEFVAEFCYNLSDHIDPIIEGLTEITDKVEDKILDKIFDEDLREDVITVKRQSITLKRHIAPQRDVINSLKNCGQSWISQADKRHFQENFEHISRYVEDLDEIKERAHVVHDEMANAISRKLNKNMYLISVLTAIFMPLTFITGLFGMNVGGIPMNTSSTGFWIIAVSLSILALIPAILRHKMLKNL
ncbi:MAG: zinc transporter [Myxococcota bacterium]|jgi:zinc transporter